MRYLLAVLCALAVVVTQVLYGGAMRPVFAMPGLALTGVAGALGLVAVFWRNIPAPSVSCVLSVLALAGWLIWRELESPDTWMAGGYLRLTLGCLVMYLLFAGVITNPFHRLAFVSVLLLAAVVQAGLAGLQFARPETGAPIPWLSEQLRVWYAERWNDRGHGTYLNGNHLAWFLNTTGIMALVFSCWGRWGLKVKILCVYVALASFAGSLITLSRGGLLGLVAGLVVFLLLSAQTLVVGARDRRIVAILVVAAALVASGALWFLIFQNSFVVQQRFEGLVRETYRPIIFQAVLRQVQLDPIWGTGAGSFLYYGRAFRETNVFSDDVYAHNDWMQVAADFGVPAFAFLVWVVWAHATVGLNALKDVLLRRMAVHSRPQSHAAALLIGGLACLAVFVVHSFFDFNMQVPANALLASACLGMLGNSGAAGEKKVAVGGFFRRFAVLVASGAAFWLIMVTIGAAGPEYRWLQAENAQLEGRLEESWEFAVCGLEPGSHGRLERLMGELYLTAALSAGTLGQREVWARTAAGYLERSGELAPEDGRNHLLQAEALEMAGLDGEKRAIEGIRWDPASGRGYELYAEMLEHSGRLAEAHQIYQVAMRLPGNTHSWKSAKEIGLKLKILRQ